MIAAQAKNGERLWSATIPSSQPPCVAGDTIYVVDTAGRLLALARSSGKTKWTMKLPEAKSWAGPVLANGSLWLVSSAGTVVGVDATTGTLGSQVSIGEASYIPPIVAQGRMFVLTDTAKLIALN
jgi:outer membrane protein assembly factor BamB